MLIITNGSSAVRALKQAGITAAFLSWDDVLHDGPVPDNLDLEALSRVRAHFISKRGWGSLEEIERAFSERDQTLYQAAEQEDEILLWFEHDLYDQLQLLQVLDWFAQSASDKPRLTLLCEAAFISESPLDQLSQALDHRALVTPLQLEQARSAWAAFRAPTPVALNTFIQTPHISLPFLNKALTRLLEEYPSQHNGLSRNEQQILTAVDDGISDPVGLFRSCLQQEEAKYLGDSSFWVYLASLINGETPLLQCASSLPFQSPFPLSLPGFKSQRIHLTPTGKAVLKGEQDWVQLHAMDRWIGGTHLTPENCWRWDTEQQRVIQDH